ncbi:MAG TPA: hypothetical protein DCY13_05285 [Verrucomicrobiales bacterium]|nr:hypothetical protein [Verrucomicrobiales bacterium]
MSLHFHLTGGLQHDADRIGFLERPGSRSGAALRSAGELRIEYEGAQHRVALASCLRGDPVTSFREGRLPEVLLVCTNPDQLLDIVSVCVELLEAIEAAGQLRAGGLPFPAVVLCANGIYHQRVRQVFVEKLEEATLFGRLPDLWPDLMPAIVGRWLRGVSIQTGVRDGYGADTVYHPGPPGRTRIAGGASEIRQRVVELCAGRGAWFENAGDVPPTRIEFDKAVVNLASNLIGLLQAIDGEGRFHALKVAEISGVEMRERIDRLAAEVFRIGQKVKAYTADDDLGALTARLHASLDEHRDHVPSSVQWVGMQLCRGRLEARITPTEQWLLEPLIRYAGSAGLPETVAYLEGLKRELLDRLELAAGREANKVGADG